MITRAIWVMTCAAKYAVSRAVRDASGGPRQATSQPEVPFVHPGTPLPTSGPNTPSLQSCTATLSGIGPGRLEYVIRFHHHAYTGGFW